MKGKNKIQITLVLLTTELRRRSEMEESKSLERLNALK